ncbi:MAG: flippase-like domain-containing protein [Anaeromicrobium sp.]|jgi:uncharacterized protein (TIRG00374 family)|uniref:lysylphosphatidylglycerol synthase transmembrane domain-containing protein n=1 Tax=Anaeromicrobium sp. TaxID=1929132 RepID=UPI0025D69DBF|nr:lysylphosphatidylglycerol synthase transmembrane domain-containing protein [Anaeromicrobium sp.]MCT4592730.1 flippase-like domain-containing protein [Anaeromicrobium sp.]
MDFNKIKKGFFISFIIGIILLFILGVYSDYKKLVLVFKNFNYGYLPMILCLAPLNYFFRYIKWSYYLKSSHINVPSKDNVLIFLSGLAMTISPGKVGEFLKSYVLKEKYNVPYSKSSPLIIGERFTDGISVLILSFLGGLYFKDQLFLLFVILLLVIGFIYIIGNKKIIYGILKKIHNIKYIRKHEVAFINFYENIYTILKGRILLVSILIGLVSWFFEGVVIYFTIKALGGYISIWASVFIVSFSFILGALSMIPGGLVAVEGSLIGFLVFIGINKDLAVATTIISRFSTLWLGVSIGIVSLLMLYKNRD